MDEIKAFISATVLTVNVRNYYFDVESFDGNHIKSSMKTYYFPGNP